MSSVEIIYIKFPEVKYKATKVCLRGFVHDECLLRQEVTLCSLKHTAN